MAVVRAKQAQFAKERELKRKEEAKYAAEREARFAKRRKQNKNKAKSMTQTHVKNNKEMLIVQKLQELESLKQ